MAESFQEDVLYKNLIPEDKRRKVALPIFFKCYMGMYPEGSFLSSSKQLEAVSFIFYPQSKVSSFKKYTSRIKGMIGMIALLRCLTPSQFYTFMRGIYSHSSAWIRRCVEGDFIHLDLIVVQPQYRGMGYGKELVQKIVEEATELGVKVTLETQNPRNVVFYERFGFCVVEEQVDEKMTQYNMVKEL